MPKLRLKRTPTEEAERELKKARKAARRAAKRKHLPDHDSEYEDRPHSQRKRRRTPTAPSPKRSAARSPPPRRPRTIRAEVEEARFREKLWGAADDDGGARLDALEATLNAYAHVPRRWRGGGMERMDDDEGIDPQVMEDEDYAEWVRAGMWRRKHAAEYEEQQRRKAERQARIDREEALHEETKKMERLAEDERRQKRSKKEAHQLLGFEDVPWPVHALSACATLVAREESLVHDFTLDAISSFLFPHRSSSDEDEQDPAERTKKKRDRLRETMLRYHPDKFEGRVGARVKPSEQYIVKEAVGIVARSLNALLDQCK
ncbi:uncharacterized protein BXZ73DRAFT_103084 [Epithele typhae]|uniref:uncharacterized protein n=1 Tax=Epithele typhae TaxID=378194 RepID=UPI002008A731|nr:uncharacterized protein BXZ73DRAFT_103084 [Epithele typhae]KAH9925914.1 hypothetical protein BXZ73DRAFT_103084 [Epithele typhae]